MGLAPRKAGASREDAEDRSAGAGDGPDIGVDP
jgi:hypothetical protein